MWTTLQVLGQSHSIKFKAQSYCCVANKGPSSQSYGFSSSHEWMWELDYKESRALKIWCFWTVVLEETLESLLDCKEIQPVQPKGNQSWIFTGRTDADAEAPNTLVTWYEELTHLKTLWCWERLRAGGEAGCGGVVIEDEMVGWHHWLDGHGFGWTLGVGDGQGSLVCCSSWGHKESNMTEWLNWTELDSNALSIIWEKDYFRSEILKVSDEIFFERLLWIL